MCDIRIRLEKLINGLDLMSPEIDLYMNRQLIFDKGTEPDQREKERIVFLGNDAGIIGFIYTE